MTKLLAALGLTAALALSPVIAFADDAMKPEGEAMKSDSMKPMKGDHMKKKKKMAHKKMEKMAPAADATPAADAPK